jgi:hypothetical protein
MSLVTPPNSNGWNIPLKDNIWDFVSKVGGLGELLLYVLPDCYVQILASSPGDHTRDGNHKE